MTAEPIPAAPQQRITVTSPLSGKEVGSVDVATPADVTAAVGRARLAFPDWSALGPRGRRPFLMGFTKHVLKRMDDIADVLVAETGKDRGEAMAEITGALAVMDYTARNAPAVLRSRRGAAWPFPTTKGWMEYHPLGVAGVITPWNYPFHLSMIATIQALGAGCTVVLKPSEITPHSGALVAEMAAEAGIPDGVVNVIHGYGATGAALVDAADVVAFIGSTATGKKIAAKAAETLKPVILELGGKDAMIVLEDAHIPNAARAAVTFGVINAGQTCVGVERVYVVQDVYDQFVAEAKKVMKRLTVADGGRGDIGPLINRAQADVIERHVKDAVDQGAVVIHGGHRVDTEHGVYFEPTLVLDVNHAMDLLNDETFGPVLPITSVPDETSALRLANDSAFGLHGSVWTRDKRRGERVASQMKTGTVAINDHLINFFYPTIKLGGIDDSGMGGLLGEDGIRSFCATKSITEARWRPTSKLMGGWLPRRVGPRYWKLLAKSLFGWRR
jgi:acyl-CoA reductase-like NAD-dependent aldehyde dehydrogenase